MIHKTRFYSWKTGRLAEGCRLCAAGKKTVLFITGICTKNCFYCPIADTKKNRDVVYANEKKIRNSREIIEEVKLCSGKGVGITGGDPMARIRRVIRFIKILKHTFGKDFHIHLYTPLELVSKQKLEKLHKSGLDEIRFHPDADNKRLWHKILFEFNGSKGVEIPVVPGKEKETKDLIDFVEDKIDFINLNELEYSDTNAQQMSKKGLLTKNRLSYAIKGSEQLAKKLLNYCASKKINAHYCTAKLKDSIQLRNRLKNRARNIATIFDQITSDGTLIRGAVYLQKPGIEQLKTRQLKQLAEAITKLSFPAILDRKKPRILAAVKNIKKYKAGIKQLNLVPAIIEEYPTSDALEVEAEFL